MTPETHHAFPLPFPGCRRPDAAYRFGVWYAKNPRFVLPQHDEGDPEFNLDEFAYLGDVAADLKDEVYAACNWETTPLTEDDCHRLNAWITERGINHCSMSIGDLIHDYYTGKWFAVAMMGFAYCTVR